MKVKVTRNYFDQTLNRRINAGEVIDVSEDRVQVLADARVATVIAEKKNKQALNDEQSRSKENLDEIKAKNAPDNQPEIVKKGRGKKN